MQGIWHAYVLDKVLPYIIEQKEKKLFRKKVSTFGGGAAVSLYQVFHGARKAWQGHRGVVRGFYADVLATHLITHDCELADAIVDELYSEAECKVIKRMDSKPAGELLADKMRSG